MLVTGCSEDVLVTSLCEAFGVDADVARHDVSAFLAELEAHGLLGG
jgi:hypothetical protein